MKSSCLSEGAHYFRKRFSSCALVFSLVDSRVLNRVYRLVGQEHLLPREIRRVRVAPAFLIAIMGCTPTPRPDVGNYVHNSYIDEVIYKYKAGQYDKDDLKNAFDAYREKLRMERLKLDVQEKELNDYSELFL